MSEGRFQVGVSAVIQRKSDGQILLIKRHSNNPVEADLWEYPAGRLRQFESFEDGLRREVKEETGITQFEVIAPLRTFTYMRAGNAAENELKGVTFWCKTDQSEVKLSGEHDEYKWLPIDETTNFLKHGGIKDDLIALRDINRLAP